MMDFNKKIWRFVKFLQGGKGSWIAMALYYCRINWIDIRHIVELHWRCILSIWCSFFPFKMWSLELVSIAKLNELCWNIQLHAFSWDGIYFHFVIILHVTLVFLYVSFNKMFKEIFDWWVKRRKAMFCKRRIWIFLGIYLPLIVKGK